MIFDILTLFPRMFAAPLGESIVGKAVERGLIEVRTHNIRDYAKGKHQVTDDRPFGGGEGMVMKPEPIMRALDKLKVEDPQPRVVLLSPQGNLFKQETAWKLSLLPRLVLICGRYEGVDERIAKYAADEEISIGDYVLSGGEFAAMVVIDAITRLIPGVLGNAASVQTETFSESLLEFPQYTRPQEYRGNKVPDVLLSGNHRAIKDWRRGQALLRTKLRRPDLFGRLQLSSDDLRFLRIAEKHLEEAAEEMNCIDD